MAQIDIGGRLHSTATGNVVAGANEVLDDILNKKQNEVNNISINQTYRKSETYSKEELNQMITTPNQEFVSVSATSETTSITDILPAEGEKNTIYRVGNWDGTEYTTGCYTEYAWDGSDYVLLSTKEPGIDGEPTLNSDNLVKSGGVAGVTGKLTNTNYLLAGCKENVFDKSYVRVGKGIRNLGSGTNEDGTIVAESAGCITCYFRIPDEADVLHLAGGLKTENSLKIRFVSEPNDTITNPASSTINTENVLVTGFTGTQDYDLTSFRTAHPRLKYFCVYVYRDNQVDALDDFSIIFEDAEEVKLKEDVATSSNNIKELQKQVSSEIVITWGNGFIKRNPGETDDGQEVSSTSYRVSDYIPVKADDIYIAKGAGWGNVYRAAYYDESKVFVGGAPSTGSGVYTEIEIIIPTGVAYCRVSSANTQPSPVSGEDPIPVNYGIQSIGNINTFISPLGIPVNEKWSLGYVATDGVKNTLSGTYYKTDPIPVSKGEKYLVGVSGSGSVCVVSFFTTTAENEHPVSYIMGDAGTTYQQLPVEVPEGVAYMRVVKNIAKEGDYIVRFQPYAMFQIKENSKNIEALQGNLSSLMSPVDATWDYGYITAVEKPKPGAEPGDTYKPNDVVPTTSGSYQVSGYIDINSNSKYVVGIGGSTGTVGVLFYKKIVTPSVEPEGEPTITYEVITDGRILNANKYQQLVITVPAEAGAMRLTKCATYPGSDAVSKLGSIFNTTGESDSYKGNAQGTYYLKEKMMFGFLDNTKKPCVTFSMDINGSSAESATTLDFINKLKEIGIAPTLFIMPRQLQVESTRKQMIEYVSLGAELAIHSDPNDKIGAGNKTPHPTIAEFREIMEESAFHDVPGYIPCFNKYGFTPIGWCTSNGAAAAPAVDPAQGAENGSKYPFGDYLIHAATTANGAYSPTWDAEEGDHANDGFNPSYCNSASTDRMAINRWGLETTRPRGYDFATDEEKEAVDEQTTIINAAQAIIDNPESTEEQVAAATENKRIATLAKNSLMEALDEKYEEEFPAALQTRNDNIIKAAKKAIDTALADNGLIALYCHSFNMPELNYTLREEVFNAIIEKLKPLILRGHLVGGTTADVVKYYYDR